MDRYVLGVCLDQHQRVVMIRKARPAWQAGRLNFPGGRIEGNETPEQAMSREWLEEVHEVVPPSLWHRFAIMRERGAFEVFCFRTTWQTVMGGAAINTHREDEPIEMRPPGEFDRSEFLPNCHWLLRLALDRDFRKGIAVVPYGDYTERSVTSYGKRT